MKRNIFIFICLCLFIGCQKNNTEVTSQSLEADFMNPPDSIQTSVYWYWLSDHLSEEGVIKDLQAMKKAGINRAFIGNIGMSDESFKPGNVKFYSEEWWKILHAALKTAAQLNIEIGIFNSPGWSQSGGPWVKPEQAMRYLASSTTLIIGGQRTNIILEKPKGDFQDVKVIAYPAINTENSLLSNINTKITSISTNLPVQNLIDGNRNTEVIFGSKMNEVIFDFIVNKEFTMRSLKIYPSYHPINCIAKLEAEKNGVYKMLSTFNIDRYNPELQVGFDPYAPVVISTPKTVARKFRLTLTDVPQNSGIQEIAISSMPVIERYPEKTLAKMYQQPIPEWNEYQWPDQPITDDQSLIIDPAKVIDISRYLSGDSLVWDAPKGNWVVMRMGMAPTGVTNTPARPEATGLETDKMSKKHIEEHFNAFLGEIIRRIPAEDRKTWKVIVADSYETGGQNFTDDFIEIFKKRYNYDPVPFLPAYNGIVVHNEDVSNRFLWDLRRLISDKVAYDYVGGLRDVAHKHGLTTWLENYGHWGFPGEFLQYGGQSDEIGGEFWSEGTLGHVENRAASSCGHIYGKTKISAESFTAAGGGYHRYPALMKQRGDLFFTEGINNTLLHVYISQPYEDKEPGVNAWFGNEFNRKNTWFSHLYLFISYLKRVNFMLQQGLNIADAAYFIGEDAPKMTGIIDPALPKGYQFDFVNAEVIEKYMKVKNGLLTLPSGTQYRILVLPKLETMRPELLKKIQSLIENGAVVLGSAPKRSPSYENYPEADIEVKQTAQNLWSKINPEKKYANIGKGMLINGMNMEEAFALINCAPDCKTASSDPVLYNHRSTNGMEIYFISNQKEKKIEFNSEFRVKGMQPELWNPVTGSIRKLPAYSQTETGTIIPMQLDAFESAFIVFRSASENKTFSTDLKMNYPDPQVIDTLNKAWTLIFDKSKRGPENPVTIGNLIDISTSENPDIKYYSGTILYQTTFNLASKPKDKRLYINLNDLSAMATIKINGKYAGGVWTAPYRVDITDYVNSGKNKIEIELVTTWANRLIGDQKLPEEQRKTWLTAQVWKASDPLFKSGLIGPVLIEAY